ncbi:MAG: YgaP family membrane protein [Verrucomicrobiota bacterium]
MKTNIGSLDSGVRFVSGCLIGLWGIHRETWWGLVGLLPFLTALAGFCPLYALFHIDTTARDH